MIDVWRVVDSCPIVCGIGRLTGWVVSETSKFVINWSIDPSIECILPSIEVQRHGGWSERSEVSTKVSPLLCSRFNVGSWLISGWYHISLRYVNSLYSRQLNERWVKLESSHLHYLVMNPSFDRRRRPSPPSPWEKNSTTKRVHEIRLCPMETNRRRIERMASHGEIDSNQWAPMSPCHLPSHASHPHNQNFHARCLWPHHDILILQLTPTQRSVTALQLSQWWRLLMSSNDLNNVRLQGLV
jgi:hypothetical protein